MHIEVLVEDSSGKTLLDLLLPKILGPNGDRHTWRLHPYRGIGRIPPGMAGGDPAKRMLLDQLPRLLAGYAKTPGIDAVVVVVDTDERPCADFLAELTKLADVHAQGMKTLFRLAIEEIEAWYLGDRAALLAAYPRAKLDVLKRYEQDSVCGTWELLADAIHPGGAEALRRAGWPLPGQVKHQWATAVGPRLTRERNKSPSFGKLRDGLQRLVGDAAGTRPG